MGDAPGRFALMASWPAQITKANPATPNHANWSAMSSADAARRSGAIQYDLFGMFTRDAGITRIKRGSKNASAANIR